MNTNGVISFTVQVSGHGNAAFPLGNNKGLVAPFWADADTRIGGEVYYRETVDTALLERANSVVHRAFVGKKKFQASWLLIATWDRVAFYGAQGSFKQKV